LSKEDQIKMLKKLESQLENNERIRMDEMSKQKMNLQLKLAQRRARNAKNNKGKEKQ